MGRLGARILSLILCFQLAVSCNNYEASITVSNFLNPIPEGSIRFNGILSKTFNLLSDSLMSSAVAAEGTITVYDINDPNAPKVIHSQTISGRDDFSIDLKEEVSSGLIGVHFESTEDPLKNRLYLTEVAPEITADMNQMESFKSEILYHQLSQEVSSSLVDLDAVKERFSNLNQEYDFDTEVKRFGNELGVKNLLNLSAETRQSMLELIASARMQDSQKDDSAQLGLRNQFFEFAGKEGAIKDEFILTCDIKGASVYLSKNRDFYMDVEAVELGLIEKSGQNWSTSGKIFEHFSHANTQIQDLMEKLHSYYKESKEVYSLKISFRAVDTKFPFNDNGCRIFPIGISEEEYKEYNLNDPSVDFQFSKKIFDDIDVNTFSTLAQAKAAYKNAVDQSILELETKLIGMKVSSIALSSIVKNQRLKALDFYEKKISSIVIKSNPVDIVFDSTYLDSVTLVNTTNISEAFSMLMSNFDRTIKQLKNDLLVVNELSTAEALPIYKAQVALAGQLMNERIIYFFDHYQVLSDAALIPFHADLTDMSELNPTHYSTLADFSAVFKPILENSQTNLAQTIVAQDLHPSSADLEIMKNRHTMVSKIKNYEAEVYFVNLFTP
jgi:hypothetical protein